MSSVETYFGTTRTLILGMTIGPQPTPYSAAKVVLDTARPPGVRLRSAAVWAAGSIREATAIAAIRAYSPRAATPHSAIRVYRVLLEPFHVAPVVVLEELQRRVVAHSQVQPLIREYWEPTGSWQLNEILAPSLTVTEEVTPASEAETYIPRWVRYNEDRSRARSL